MLTRLVLGAAAVLVMVSHCHAQTREHRAAQAPATATPPAIDGRLSPGEWDGAAVLTGFIVHNDDMPPKHQTAVHVAWDRERLYLSFRCESPLPPLAAETERDARVWRDDAVEVFLQPDPERERYYQFVGNSRGTIFDSRGFGEPEWNGKWEYRASTGEGYWEGELSLAWSELGLQAPEPGTIIGFNACREQQVPTRALSCWSPVSGQFHDKSQFGRLTLTE